MQYNATDNYYIHMVVMVTRYMYVHIYIIYIDASTTYIYVCICAISHTFQSTYIRTYTQHLQILYSTVNSTYVLYIHTMLQGTIKQIQHS